MKLMLATYTRGHRSGSTYVTDEERIEGNPRKTPHATTVTAATAVSKDFLSRIISWTFNIETSCWEKLSRVK